MKKTFEVTITETLKLTVEVKANSREEAEQFVSDRWHDSELGGGLWYNDTHGSKALYETGIALTWLRLWEITGEQRFYCPDIHTFQEADSER